MREKQRRKKGRTWAEAAKTVLEKYPNTAMSHKEILQVIQREGLKEISGTSPLACLNAMLHTNSRGDQGIFYKVPGRMGVYTLKKEVSDDGSDSSDVVSDSQSPENGNTATSKEGRRGKWRRVTSKLQSQPASPQSRCSSPSVPAKLISPSQKHSKKALKQALKQQRNQRRVGMTSSSASSSSSSSSQMVLKRGKEPADPPSRTKAAWELKQSTQRSASPPNSSSSSSSSSSAKADLCPSVSTRKMSQRSDRLNARQLKRTKCAEIDVETPDSILVNTNLRALINKHTLSILPQDCQHRLLALLPDGDRQICADGQWKLSSSALNNEFFTSAAQSWKERLAEGDFTPEMRLRVRQELEKGKKMEPWKEEFFESYYGQTSGLSLEESRKLTEAVPSPECSEPQPALPPAPKSTPTPPPKSVERVEEVMEAAKECPPEKEERGEESPSPVLKPETPERGPVAKATTTPAPDRPRVPDTPPTPAPKTPETSSSPKPEEKARPVQSDTAPGGAVQSEEASEGVAKAEATPPEDRGAGKATPTPVDATPVAEAPRTEPAEPAAPEPAKRKSSSSEQEVAPSPEKRPRVAETPPQTPPPRPPLEVKARPAAPRVPPLKIPVCGVLPTSPAGGGQVSPRFPPLPSPPGGPRTGARTLADIKAKAQLARAQRVAAAAAAAAAGSPAGGAVPGPGPGGGPPPKPPPGAPPRCPAQSGPAAAPSVTTVTPSANRPGPSGATPRREPLPPGKLGGPSTISAAGHAGVLLAQRLSGPSAVVPGGQPVALPPHGVTRPVTHPNLTPAPAQRTPEIPPALRAGTSITSSNPLVCKLLQGKEVPLEHILPKPPPKPHPCAPLSVRRGLEGPGAGAGPVRGEEGDRLRPPPAQDPGPHHQREMLNQATQEQILHTLMQRAHHHHQVPHPQFLPPAPAHLAPLLLRPPPDGPPAPPRLALGFLSRKRPSRPAMTGHYLLNVSTYGRGSESGKRALLAAVPASGLKREPEDEEEAGEEGRGAGEGPWATSDLSGVKTERQPGSSPEDEESDPQRWRVKAESPLLGHPDAAETDRAGAAQGPSGSRRRTASGCESHAGRPGDRSPAETGGGSPGDSPASSSGSVMSFSVTVTAIPAERHGDAPPLPGFAQGPGMDVDSASKCYCRLKAMIMCRGCGAFCHHDCIGPSKLCVSCLVVR
ncbi:putative Polycomb group protein ASXL2 [Conger conger]|uniref:putative Polycomb group protein ASXL2 n=1 Tax=Conger conger TaxID=82655 RepID=UPI002A5AB4FB|nr:putative Polycomb group protein ASXL2 [Conger conger]